MVQGVMLAAMFHALPGPGTEAMAADVVLAQARADFSSVTPANGNTTATWGGGLGIPDTYGREVSTTGCGHWNYLQSDNANPTSGALSLLSWQLVGNALNSGYGGSGNFYGFLLPAIGASRIFNDSAAPAADQVTWHPYAGGQPYAVLRWTSGAAESGLIKIEGAIERTGEGGNGYDSFAVFVNGVSQFSVASLHNGDSRAFSFSLPVSAGQNVDFVLGGITPGANEAKLSATISTPPPAADYTWGGGNLLWSDTSAGGWSGGPPVAGDTATIPSGTVSFAQHDTFGIASTTTSASINLNGGTLASAGWFNTIWNLNMNGGILLCNGGAYPQYPAFQLAGTLTATGSDNINVGSGVNNAINIGGNGNPALTVSTPNATDSLTVTAPLQNCPYSPNSLTKTGPGTLTLNAVNTYTGDTAVAGGTLAIGAGGSVTNTSQVNAYNDGILSVSGSLTVANNSVFAVGSSFGSAGTMVIHSGAVVNAGGGSGGYVGATYIGGKINNIGTEGVGTLTIDGGILNVAAGGDAPGGDGSHVWLNPYGGAGSTINLNGGTLSTARPITDGSGDVAYFNFNGGVLQAAASDFNILEDLFTPLAVTLQTGGGTIDTNGHNVSITSAIGGSGSLIKLGAGTLTLTRANTYAGNTTVNGGTLAIQQPCLAAASNIVIAAAGKLSLDFDESLGDVSNTVATLTINGVAKASGAWGATGSGATHIDDTHFAGVGTLTVTTWPTLTDYDNWIGPFFPGVTDPLVIGASADPDGDGVTNRAEYAFGLLPNSGTSANPITVPLDKGTGTITYTRRDPALTSLTYTVWTSTDLAVWTEDPGALQSAGPTNPSGVQVVGVTLTTPPTTPSCFIQVRAN